MPPKKVVVKKSEFIPGAPMETRPGVRDDTLLAGFFYDYSIPTLASNILFSSSILSLKYKSVPSERCPSLFLTI